MCGGQCAVNVDCGGAAALVGVFSDFYQYIRGSINMQGNQ